MRFRLVCAAQSVSSPSGLAMIGYDRHALSSSSTSLVLLRSLIQETLACSNEKKQSLSSLGFNDVQPYFDVSRFR